MKNSEPEFVIYNRMLSYKSYVRKYITNSIPAKDRDLRIHFLDELYSLFKNLFYATYNKGNIRMKHLIELFVNISLLDMLTSEIKKNAKINEKYINTSIAKLSDVKNLVYAWRINEEKKKSS